MVSHDALLAAPNSELMTAYVDAVMVPSKPYRKTLVMMAISIHMNPEGGVHVASSGASRMGWLVRLRVGRSDSTSSTSPPLFSSNGWLSLGSGRSSPVVAAQWFAGIAPVPGRGLVFCAAIAGATSKKAD